MLSQSYRSGSSVSKGLLIKKGQMLQTNYPDYT